MTTTIMQPFALTEEQEAIRRNVRELCKGSRTPRNTPCLAM
jgi:hypothetical protein